ncbi:MAG TPA: DEAD/DEAH box helicase, partial [Candidatus Deferrimicrobium sp.]|nr:DEAD/DEAH box helicase [Candidatus Deferrimicrobium sp.]
MSLSPGGPIAGAMPGFESRPGQLRMALAWAEALETPRVLVVEAATGIGKTLAYLVPAILSGRKTIVSTGTRTLQQQLMENDIPLVRDILQYPFSCAVLKGRGNYLCLRRWKRFRAEPLFEFAREAGYFSAMQAFAETTRTGDVSECARVPEDARVWGEVNARSEMCDSSTCGETERCHLATARRRAADADLVVVNHHLFFADLALRERLGPGRGGEEGRFGEVLPRADAVVFDEAHGVEETASVFFGVTVSLGRARELARDVKRSAAKAGGGWDALLPMAERFRLVAESAFDAVGDGEARFALPAPSAGTPFGQKASALLRAGEELALSLSDGAPAGRGVRIRGRTGTPCSGGSAPSSTISARSSPPTPPPPWRGRSGAVRPSPCTGRRSRSPRSFPERSGGSGFRSCSPRRPSPYRETCRISASGWGSHGL